MLPPVSILTPEQTKYYFLSGFTAKLAGTERGITEPTPTFSACFGQAFLELHPTKYAEELVKKMEKSGAKAYLVNTGWNGTGKRISIKDTRGIIDAILNGDILNAPTKKIPYFDFEVPTELPGVDSRHPRSSRHLRRHDRMGNQGQGSRFPLHQELRQVRRQRSRQEARRSRPEAVITAKTGNNTQTARPSRSRRLILSPQGGEKKNREKRCGRQQCRRPHSFTA